MSAPVCGFRPFLALCCEMQKVPKPTRVTRSDFLRAENTLLIKVSITAVACVLLTSCGGCDPIYQICLIHRKTP